MLVDGLNRVGWPVAKPKATMFVWAPIPEHVRRHMGSLEFSTFLLQEGKVAVSPGIGFGEYGDRYVRFALIENEHRTRQAVRGIRRALRRPARRPSIAAGRLTARQASVAAGGPSRADRLRHDRHRGGQAAAAQRGADPRRGSARGSTLVRIADIDLTHATAA